MTTDERSKRRTKKIVLPCKEEEKNVVLKASEISNLFEYFRVAANFHDLKNRKSSANRTETITSNSGKLTSNSDELKSNSGELKSNSGELKSDFGNSTSNAGKNVKCECELFHKNTPLKPVLLLCLI